MNQVDPIRLLVVLSIYLSLAIAPSATADGQPLAQQPDSELAADHRQQWYYGDNSAAEPQKSLAQQKAEMRAEQRMARMEAMKWYGFSPGRPTAAALPFTSMYSPAWSQPGGRPFAWYIGGRPNIIVPKYYYRYR